jgi:hypothetical protein
MDDCIGRLDTEVGVDRTATEQAACNVVQWPINGGRIRALDCAHRLVGPVDGVLHAVRVTKLSHNIGGAQVRLYGEPAADTDPATATQWRPVVMGKAINHARERASMSAAGGVGAISCRSPRN